MDKDKISDWVGDVTDFLKDLFGIASPSKLMRDEIGVYLAQGIGVGFSNEIGGVKKMIEDSVPQEFDVDAKVNVGNEFKYDNDDQKAKAERWRQCSRRRSCQSVYLCEYHGLCKAAERGSSTVQNDSKDGVTHGKWKN